MYRTLQWGGTRPESCPWKAWTFDPHIVDFLYNFSVDKGSNSGTPENSKFSTPPSNFRRFDLPYPGLQFQLRRKSRSVPERGADFPAPSSLPERVQTLAGMDRTLFGVSQKGSPERCRFRFFPFFLFSSFFPFFLVFFPFSSVFFRFLPFVPFLSVFSVFFRFFPFFSVSFRFFPFFPFLLFFRVPIFSFFFRFLPFSSVFFPFLSVFFRFLPFLFRFLPFFPVFFRFFPFHFQKKTGRYRSRDPFCETPICAAGKLGRNFPAVSKFAGKPSQQRVLGSRSLRELCDCFDDQRSP